MADDFATGDQAPCQASSTPLSEDSSQGFTNILSDVNTFGDYESNEMEMSHDPSSHLWNLYFGDGPMQTSDKPLGFADTLSNPDPSALSTHTFPFSEIPNSGDSHITEPNVNLCCYNSELASAPLPSTSGTAFSEAENSEQLVIETHRPTGLQKRKRSNDCLGSREDDTKLIDGMSVLKLLFKYIRKPTMEDMENIAQDIGYSFEYVVNSYIEYKKLETVDPFCIHGSAPAGFSKSSYRTTWGSSASGTTDSAYGTHIKESTLTEPQVREGEGSEQKRSKGPDTASQKKPLQCPNCYKHFSRQGDLKRHLKKYLPGEFRCLFPGCSRVFYRKDKYDEHCKKAHKDYSSSSNQNTQRRDNPGADPDPDGHSTSGGSSSGHQIWQNGQLSESSQGSTSTFSSGSKSYGYSSGGSYMCTESSSDIPLPLDHAALQLAEISLSDISQRESRDTLDTLNHAPEEHVSALQTHQSTIRTSQSEPGSAVDVANSKGRTPNANSNGGPADAEEIPPTMSPQPSHRKLRQLSGSVGPTNTLSYTNWTERSHSISNNSSADPQEPRTALSSSSSRRGSRQLSSSTGGTNVTSLVSEAERPNPILNRSSTEPHELSPIRPPNPSRQRSRRGSNSVIERNDIDLPRGPDPRHHTWPRLHHHIRSWFDRLRWENPQTTGWFLVMVLAIMVAAVAPITLHFTGSEKQLVAKRLRFSDMPLPLPNSKIAAAVSRFSVFPITNFSGEPDIRVAYNSDGGRICVLTKSSGSWDNEIECIEGLNPRYNTPVVLQDWIGGPSIYFVTANGLLDGVDRICHPQTAHCDLDHMWKRSTLKSTRTQVHPNSQLSSVTFLSGASSWLFFGASNNTLQEFGSDDFRDLIWRMGSSGDLAPFPGGSGIGSTWWLNSSSDVNDLFYQVQSDAIFGRTFFDSHYTEPYTVVKSTEADSATSIAAIAVDDGSESVDLLAYISRGYLTVKTRKNANLTDFSVFSSPTKIAKSGGEAQTGLAVVSWQATASIFFVYDKKILEISRSDLKNDLSANWTTSTVGPS